MALVGNKNTKPELYVRAGLHRRGFRFRVNVGSLIGRPDIVLRKHNAVVFVHGCFWHGHRSAKCKLARTPKSNVAFWKAKVAANQQRDCRVRAKLRRLGWRVFVVWECQLKRALVIDTLAKKIAA
jgi:DNA mismatch endonuclease (patch repair protein)